MKKTLVAALTSALVIGAASTTFAAANPFSDVPMDHWAYDAVSQLAADGVIEGYGDTTFRGQQNITRYEMAQMIAKAMARTNVSGADKALIDRLAAEFADELNNLGVRVSNLEKNADKVKFNGEGRYTYTSKRFENNGKTNTDVLRLRLQATGEVNDNWKVVGRFDMDTDPGEDQDDNHAKWKRAYAEGNYGKTKIRLGKQELYTNEGRGHQYGLLFDDEFSGASVKFGNELQTTLLGGRLSGGNYTDTASLQGINLQYTPSKLSVGAGYYHLNTSDFVNDKKNFKGYGDSDDANVWSVNADYNFDGTSRLVGSYANNTEADNQDYSWQAEYDYKNAVAANKGTWGAWSGYTCLGRNTSFLPSSLDGMRGYKGWDIGVRYVPVKNVVASVRWFDGEDIDSGEDGKQLVARVRCFF